MSWILILGKYENHFLFYDNTEYMFKRWMQELFMQSEKFFNFTIFMSQLHDLCYVFFSVWYLMNDEYNNSQIALNLRANKYLQKDEAKFQLLWAEQKKVFVKVNFDSAKTSSFIP